MEWTYFEELLERFWRGLDERGPDEKREGPKGQSVCEGESVAELLRGVVQDREAGKEELCGRESAEKATYSPVAILERKDLAQFERADIQAAQLILKNMISPFKIGVRRRFRRSKKPGDIDFGRIIKRSLKTDGIPLGLSYKRRKRRPKRLVVLADVSGSMDRYARFVMPFIFGLKGIGARAQVFVFSTSLTPITSILRRFSIDKALEQISQEVPDWSGGTRIGYSLHQFNQGYGEVLLNKRTVVVIMSDGWDLGGRELLKREMEAINQKAYCVIWLNPLAGDAEYEPVCRGMQAALPYVDFFLPAHSLESLKRVGRTLSRVMAH
jgi:uncharacterized protein with von Willebrand factor type A (vWA) domain